MGGTESKTSEEPTNGTSQASVITPEVAANYQFVSKSYDLRYGDIKLLRDQRDGNLLVCKETSVNTEETYEKELRFLSKKIAVSHPNIIRVEGYSTKDKQHFCASFWRISIFVEYVQGDLVQEIEDRANNNAPFSESDLLNLAENTFSGLSSLESQNHPHGDIRPLNIFVTQDYVYKLSDPSLNVQRPNALVQTVMGNAQCYLSPELLSAAEKKDMQPAIDHNKSDVYSLGLTLLAAATLTKSEDLYDYDECQFNENLFEERLQQVRDSYSKFTTELIASMLSKDPENRPTFTQLSQKLLPYQDAIRNGEPLPFAEGGRASIRASIRTEQDRPSIKSKVLFDPEELPIFDVAPYSYKDRISPFIEHFIIDDDNKFYAYNLYPNTASPTKGTSYTHSMWVRSPEKERREFAEAFGNDNQSIRRQKTSEIVQPDRGDVDIPKEEHSAAIKVVEQ